MAVSWRPQPKSDESYGKWDRSVEALGASWRLLTRTPALKATAATAFVAWIVASAVLFGPVMAWWVSTESRLALVVGSAVVAFPFLFVTVYFSVAMLAAANACMDGERLTVRESFAVANRRIPQIAAWALLSAGVGALLDALAEWLPGAGHVARWLLGTAWALATLFAIPVIVVDGVGGKEAALRSARTFRAAWGESVLGELSITFFTIVLAVPGGFALCAGVAAGATVGGFVAAGIGLAFLAVAAFLATTVERLFALVLLRYVREGEVHGGFTERQLRTGIFLK
jgi:hypothetical protein